MLTIKYFSRPLFSYQKPISNLFQQEVYGLTSPNIVLHPFCTSLSSTDIPRSVIAKVRKAGPSPESIWAWDNHGVAIQWGFEDQQLKKIGVPDLENLESTETLERQEEEARSLIFCPLVEMTPCPHRILWFQDVAERRICEIPVPAQSLTSKSPYYPKY